MFDLLYTFNDWFSTFTLWIYPVPYDNTKPITEYLYSVMANTTLLVYLVWSILFILFVWFCAELFKFMVYSILSKLGR